MSCAVDSFFFRSLAPSRLQKDAKLTLAPTSEWRCVTTSTEPLSFTSFARDTEAVLPLPALDLCVCSLTLLPPPPPPLLSVWFASGWSFQARLCRSSPAHRWTWRRSRHPLERGTIPTVKTEGGPRREKGVGDGGCAQGRRGVHSLTGWGVEVVMYDLARCAFLRRWPEGPR